MRSFQAVLLGLGPASEITECTRSAFALLADQQCWRLCELSLETARHDVTPIEVGADLLILEVDSPPAGIAQAQAFRSTHPDTALLLYGHVGDHEEVAAALRAGADDVVPYDAPEEELLARIERFGRRWRPADQRGRMAQ